MHESITHWDQLHGNPRFRPVYPTEHVVRFMMGSLPLLKRKESARFLDVGVGAGRHTKLAADLGLTACGVDVSLVGLQHAQERFQGFAIQPVLAQASMLALPFHDESFDLVLAYGVFYYGTAEQMRRAIGEARRVLTRGGRALVVLRTTNDCRFGSGEQLEHNTFRLTITETNEAGTVQHFLAEEDVAAYFSNFSRWSFEKSETTFADRRLLNSDWLVTAEK